MMRNRPEGASRGRGREVNTHRMVNSTRPSKNASYNWEAWRTSPLTLNPQGTVVTLPHNSPLMKLPIRPKNKPRPGSGTVKSSTSDTLRPRRHANKETAMMTPSIPPWNDIPPSQILKGYRGSFAQNFNP